MNREQDLADAFVELADTLVDDFDVIEFLQQLCTRCTQLLAVDAAGVFLAPPDEVPQAVAPCDPVPELADALTTAAHDGPARECCRTAAPAAPVDLHQCANRWPHFTARARHAGYSCAGALPLRLRSDTLGCLLLLRTVGSPLPAADVRLAQALADAAAIGLIHEQTLRRHLTTTLQLRTALHSRITIEQAKGVLATRLDTTVDDAFELMRAHARRHRRRLTLVAQAIIDQGLIPEAPSPTSTDHPAAPA